MYDALSDWAHDDEFAFVRIREAESITTLQLYTRLLDELSKFETLDVPETYPYPTDKVRLVVEDVADQLEETGLTCIVQVDQLEDAARNRLTFEQLLAGLQSIGDLGESELVFNLLLFGTPPPAADRIDEFRETLSSRLVAKNRSLKPFGFEETEELIAR